MRPPVISSGSLTLRTLGKHEEFTWRQLRQSQRQWLEPWEATAPPGHPEPSVTFRTLLKRERRQWRDESAYPFVIVVDGQLVGRVAMTAIQWGAARTASIGYWISREHAGRGIMPRAVALATEFGFSRGLHRVEIAVRPENASSLRVPEKLGFREEGMRRSFLHINGAWRDHRIFALTQDEPRTGRYWSEAP